MPFGKVQPLGLPEGINLVNPLHDVVEMNTRIQRHQAKYNQKVAASLTSTLIQQRYLEKWDGKLPQFSMGTGSGGPGILLNLPLPAPGK
ncbi:MAG: hypothetical protein HY712_02115 [candidate division NC10 bacterium]|nr:hypothetical protein [candidate division NC10 bacterium]